MISGRLEGSADELISWDLHPPTAKPLGFAVILHGFKGFKDWGFFPELAERLAARGFAAVRFNTSHNGVGLGEDQADFTRLDLFARNRASYELADIRTVIEGIRAGAITAEADVPRHIGLVGHSRGGPNVVLAGDHEDVRAVVTWASVRSNAFAPEQAKQFEETGRYEVMNGRTGQLMTLERTAYDDVTPMPAELDVARKLADLATPLMVIHGDRDTSVPLDHAHALVTASGERARLEVIADADHVMNCRHPFAGPTPAFDRAVELTAQHLVTYLA